MNHRKAIPESPRNHFSEHERISCPDTGKPRIFLRLCFLRMNVAVCLIMIMAACAATFERLDPIDFTDMRKRAETVVEDGIRASAVIPSREEIAAIFGLDLEGKNIQPVWLEIENNTDRHIHFLPTGLDSEYFSPLEVGFAFHRRFSDNANQQIDEHIEQLKFHHTINPHSTNSGFVFTNPDQNYKFVTLDLVGRKWNKTFSLMITTPNRSIAWEHYENLFNRIARSEMIEVDNESGLRELLEQLPCCISDAESSPGEPLNIVVIGNFEDILPAFARRAYRYQPVAPRYVFQRIHDVSFSKRAWWVAAQPHVLRAWLTNIRFRSKPVWIGQVSTLQGGRFALVTESDADLPIDSFVDEARNDLIQDFIYSQSLLKIGFVIGAGRAMASNPNRASGSAIYYTDGLRAVLVFDQGPVSFSEIEFFDWENLADRSLESYQVLPNHR